MNDKGAYEFPGWCQMETALDSYQQDRQAYLETAADNFGVAGKEQIKQLNESADALVKGVENLTGIQPLDCLGAAFMTRKPDSPFATPLDLLDEHVCIALAWESMGMLSTARERFWHLLELVKDRSPSLGAKAFLNHVARCYLFGFDAECAVMCRGTLDQEFGNRISDKDVIAWWRKSNGPKKCKSAPLNLSGRIQAAHYLGRIDKDTQDAADHVRSKGNDAVHDTPSIPEPLDCIRKTVQVLDALEGRKQST